MPIDPNKNDRSRIDRLLQIRRFRSVKIEQIRSDRLDKIESHIDISFNSYLVIMPRSRSEPTSLELKILLFCGTIRQNGHRSLADHRCIVPPFGLQGGESDSIGSNYLDRMDDSIEILGSKAEVQMAPGDVFVIETLGGGGFGRSTAIPS